LGGESSHAADSRAWPAAAEIEAPSAAPPRRVKAASSAAFEREIKRIGEPWTAAANGVASFAQAARVNAPLTWPH